MVPSVTPNDPPRPPLAGTEVETFAYITIKDRLPAILTQVVDHMYRTYTALADTIGATAAKVTEAKQIVQALGQLRYEMQTDKPITPLDADAHSDYAVWNEVIATHFAGKTWFTATWLFSECYMYRRIYQAFAVTEHWKDYDYFAEKKHSAFLAASRAVAMVADRVQTLCKEVHSASASHVAFKELVLACLWGNQADLSLLSDLNLADVHDMHTRPKDPEEFIVANHLEQWWQRVQAWDQTKEVHFVLDNTGFEVFVDMVLAHWLVVAGRCRKVVFHAKNIPWFVSDTMTKDFYWVIDTMLHGFRDAEPTAEATDIPDTTNAVALATAWQQCLADGTWEVRADPFWTLPYAFWHLPDQRPSLHRELQLAAAVIFKGDLNYRKLTYDCHWDPTTSFDQAIGPLAQPGTALSVVSLRTSKCDLIVGLAPGKQEALDKVNPKWMVSGDYAVIEASFVSQ